MSCVANYGYMNVETVPYGQAMTIFMGGCYRDTTFVVGIYHAGSIVHVP